MKENIETNKCTFGRTDLAKDEYENKSYQNLEDFKNIGADTTYLEKKEGHDTTSSFIIANMSNGSRTIIKHVVDMEVNDEK